MCSCELAFSSVNHMGLEKLFLPNSDANIFKLIFHYCNKLVEQVHFLTIQYMMFREIKQTKKPC